MCFTVAGLNRKAFFLLWNTDFSLFHLVGTLQEIKKKKKKKNKPTTQTQGSSAQADKNAFLVFSHPTEAVLFTFCKQLGVSTLMHAQTSS